MTCGKRQIETSRRDPTVSLAMHLSLDPGISRHAALAQERNLTDEIAVCGPSNETLPGGALK
jgi:hypothetical protein